MDVVRGLAASAAIMVVAIGLAGCAELGMSNERSVSLAGQGQKSGVETRSLECPDGTGRISVGGQGQGRMKITVADDDGLEIFRKEFRGSEQGGEVKDLDGAGGTWTLKVDFGAVAGIGAWQGQYAIVLSC